MAFSRNDMQLAKIELDIYKPLYNADNDCYEDICPYLPYQRNRIKYECECSSNAYFETTGKFNSHIQSKTHKRWLSYTYPKNIEKDREIKRLNKENRIKKKQLEVRNKQINKLQQINIKLRKKNKCKKS